MTNDKVAFFLFLSLLLFWASIGFYNFYLHTKKGRANKSPLKFVPPSQDVLEILDYIQARIGQLKRQEAGQRKEELKALKYANLREADGYDIRAATFLHKAVELEMLYDIFRPEKN